MNIVAKGMTNWSAKRRQSIQGNLTRCLQRNVVFGYERMKKYSISNTNNIMLQIILKQHNFDFHGRRERLGEAEQRVPTNFAL
jgi:hypothetical protein